MRTALGILVFIVAAFLAASWYERRRAASEDEGPSERGLYDCNCDYLTDTDLTGEERVRVCADGLDEARQRARGCAQTHSPGSVSRCACVLFGKIDCPQHECRLNR